MASFVWEGRSRGGDLRKGIMDADSEDAVVARLRQQEISATKVKKKAKEISITIGSGVSTKDLVIFTRQFATMINSGLPLVQSLEILSAQTENRHFGKVIADVKTRVEGGATFSESLSAHRKVFDELYCNLIAAGEVGGILDTIMNRLASYIEKAQKIRGQVKGAMVYPIAVLIIAIGVVIIMLWKVIPVFENMFKDMGAESALPAPTQIVINLSHWFINNLGLVFGGIFAIVAGFMASVRTRRGLYIFHAVLLRLPLLGVVIRKTIVARFSRTLGTLLSSGVPLLDALEITGKTAGNKVVEAALLRVRARVSEGKDLSGPLMDTAVFPPMVVQMIGVGEQTGNMDQMLTKIADFYEEEVEVAVSALTKLMEPLMMVFIGGIVGGIIVAMYLPIFELAGNIRQH